MRVTTRVTANITKADMRDITTAYRLMQLCDSALPVGGFSFSCALESAAAQGMLRSADDIEEYAGSVLRLTLLSDGVAALHALRHANSIAELCHTDRELYAIKASAEMRSMSTRMGRKLAELSAQLIPCHDTRRWLDCIAEGSTKGCYATTQGLIFSLCDAAEQDLFSAVGYGAASMVVGAALRLLRVTHHQTQQILFSFAPLIEALYAQARNLPLHQMQGFAPQLDILSSLHERGLQRMFMS